MKSAYIALGYRCNHNCILCPLTKGDRNAVQTSREQIMESVCREGLTDGDHVTLSGGEPTLVPFLPDLVADLNRLGIRMTLLTNSSGFAEIAFAERLAAAADPSRFDVVTAIHSADPALHDSITGVPGSFAQSMQGLQNLYNLGVNITVKHIVNGLTCKGLPDLARLIRRVFPPDVTVQFTSTDYSGQAHLHFPQLRVTFEEAQEPFEEALRILTSECRIPYPISIIEMPLCACRPQYWKYFRRTGEALDVYYSPHLKEEEHVIRHMVNECRPSYPECEQCDVRCFCPGSWTSAYEIMKPHLLRSISCHYHLIKEETDDE